VIEATAIGSYRSHRPEPCERKSGIPDGVEMPAPVRATARREDRSNVTARPMSSVT
jgi:hypothetical protein